MLLTINGDYMSLRSLKIPGTRLGLGTFVSNDIDGKRKIVYFGKITAVTTDYDLLFTQGQTRMATIEAVMLSYSAFDALASGSIVWGNSTLTNGTVTLRMKPKTAAGNTCELAGAVHYWMVGSPDPNRIVV